MVRLRTVSIKGRATREQLLGIEDSNRKVLEKMTRGFKSLGIRKMQKPMHISASKWKPMYKIVPKRYKR